MHKQKDGRTDRWINRQSDTHKHIQTDRQTFTDRRARSQAERQTGRQADRQTDDKCDMTLCPHSIKIRHF